MRNLSFWKVLSFFQSPERKEEVGHVNIKRAKDPSRGTTHALRKIKRILIFPTQRSNSGVPHCRKILYRLSPPGKPSLSQKRQQKCIIQRTALWDSHQVGLDTQGWLVSWGHQYGLMTRTKYSLPTPYPITTKVPGVPEMWWKPQGPREPQCQKWWL